MNKYKENEYPALVISLRERFAAEGTAPLPGPQRSIRRLPVTEKRQAGVPLRIAPWTLKNYP